MSVKAPVDGLSRRHVLQGVLWATPAVVIASAVPASAASLPEAPSGHLAFIPGSSEVVVGYQQIKDFG